MLLLEVEVGDEADKGEVEAAFEVEVEGPAVESDNNDGPALGPGTRASDSLVNGADMV